MAAAVAKPFGAALRELLDGREEFLTKTGNINFRSVASAMENIHYETLRKSVAGDRPPTVHLLREAARLTGVEPDHFAEWQLAQARRDFDVSEVGWETAVANLRSWTEAQKKR